MIENYQFYDVDLRGVAVFVFMSCILVGTTFYLDYKFKKIRDSIK